MSDLVEELVCCSQKSGGCSRSPMSWSKVSLPVRDDFTNINRNFKPLPATSSSNHAVNSFSAAAPCESNVKAAAPCEYAETKTYADADGDSIYPWTLRYIEKRGFCAFANRCFSPGDLLMTEAPTVTVKGHHPFTLQQKEEIDFNIQKLSTEDKNAFYCMSNVFPESGSAAGIFMTNSFDMVDSPGGTACGMYVALARLNHSCIPNVQQTHVPSSGCEVLHASRKIEIGDEICDCYIDLRQDKESRRKELLESFRFLCECPACVHPSSLEESTLPASSSSSSSSNSSFPSSSSSFPSSSSSSCLDGQLESGGIVVVADGNIEDLKNEKEVEKENERVRKRKEDDEDRLFAACFEDESIDFIVAGQHSEALKVLRRGLSVLQKPCNAAWSIRYQAGAHLMVHQVLLHQLQDSSCHDGISSDRKGNRSTGNNRGCRSTVEKRSRRDKLGAENASAADEEIAVALMRKHLHQAHLLNLQLQGPTCPETINTDLLVKKHCFTDNFCSNYLTD